MIIDAHVHYTPPALAANLAAFAEREPYWGLLLNPPSGRSIQGWATAEQMIADMDAAGVDRVVLVGEYFRYHENCVARNDQAIELVRRWPDRILALATVQPTAGVHAHDELRRCLEHGLVGVGELNPYAQGFELQSQAFEDVVRVCADFQVPINLHVSEAAGGYYLGKSTTPLRHYYELAVRFPEVKLIYAHWGGGLLYYEMMPQVRRQLRNVWYDTAASPLLYPTKRIFPAALAMVDHRKLLFGSDYPLLIYPRKMVGPDMRPFMAAIDKVSMDETVRADIMGLNAARLFGVLPYDQMGTRVKVQSERLERDHRPPVTGEIDNRMPVRLMAATWPETRAVLASHGIPVEDQPVPVWEPLGQAAARQGMGPQALQQLIVTLNEVIAADSTATIEVDNNEE